MTDSHILTSVSIYAALLSMSARFWGDLNPASMAWATQRMIWSFGCLAFLVHVWSAFQFHHHWSHSSAFEVTAQRTEEMLGFRFGEGIYFSYVFTLLWLLDVAWMWFSPESYRKRKLPFSIAIDCFLAFIAFNGAVIFEGGVTRWLGIPIAAVLAWQAIHIWLHPSAKTNTSPLP
jgi:hypothetical protein